jgi:FkbM family methyltransferase
MRTIPSKLGHEPWLRHCVPRRGRLALDIGACHGHYTRLLARRFDRVHAFEPNPYLAPDLAEAAEGGNVEVFELALGNVGGRRTLRIYDDPELATLAVRPFEGEPAGVRQVGTVTVRQHRLDRLGYANRPVDFVKIDTEGAELAVLQGAKRTLTACRPIVLVETHSRDLLDGCLAFLNDLGYGTETIRGRWIHAKP